METQVIDFDVSEIFWSKLCECICTEITNSSGAVQQMLEDEYPKLVNMYNEMTQRLNYKPFVYK